VESGGGTNGPAEPGGQRDDLTRTLELVRLAQGGDRAALGRVLDRYRTRLRRVVRARLGPTLRGYLDSDDILQETCLAALAGFDRFDARDEGSLIHWLARLAENQIRQAAEHHHALKRDRRREQPLPDGAPGTRAGHLAGGPEPADAAPQPLARAQIDEELEAVLDVLDALGPDQREVFILRHLTHGAPRWESIARDLGAPTADAARQLYARAVAAILRAQGERGRGPV